MRTLSRARQRAEDFAALVDGADRDVDARADAELERLVEVAASLRTFAEQPGHVALLTPRAEFATELRARLITEAEVVLDRQAGENATLRLTGRRRSARDRRLVAVASAAVLLGGAAGLAAAAQNALPGEALYPIKRGVERVETTIPSSDAGTGRAMLGSATDRLDEVEGLLAQRSATGAPQVPATLEEFTEQARKGSALMFDSYSKTRDPATIDAVRRFAASRLAALRTMSDRTPAGAQDDLRSAEVTLRDIDRQARALCASCSDLPPLAAPATYRIDVQTVRAVDRLDATRAGSPPAHSHRVSVPKQAKASPAPRSSARSTPAAASGGSTSAGASRSSGTSGAVRASGGSAVQAPATHQAAPTVPKPSTPKVQVKASVGDTSIDSGNTLDQLP